MTTNRLAIVDDDPFTVGILKNALCKKFPDLEIAGIADPVAPAGFDVYIVGKDFEGNSAGADVVRRIRSISPDSLVLAYSAQLDSEFLREMIHERCDAAFDKGRLEDLASMTKKIERHLATGQTAEQTVTGFKSTLKSITSLMREWNMRISNTGRANARTHVDGK